MSLLQETIDMLAEHRLTPEDVKYVCGSDFWFTWEEFAAVANVDYDSGCGSQHVARDLQVVGRGWWIERREYDGSEWWEYVTPPKKPRRHARPGALVTRWGDQVREEEV